MSNNETKVDSINSETGNIDQDALKQFSFSVWTYKMGEQVSLMIHLGDVLGLYRAMNGVGPMTSLALANATDLMSVWSESGSMARPQLG